MSASHLTLGAIGAFRPHLNKGAHFVEPIRCFGNEKRGLVAFQVGQLSRILGFDGPNLGFDDPLYWAAANGFIAERDDYYTAVNALFAQTLRESRA